MQAAGPGARRARSRGVEMRKTGIKYSGAKRRASWTSACHAALEISTNRVEITLTTRAIK
jgi:hypothetical protein